MTVTGIITAIIVGLIIGLLGRLFAPGRQNISLVVTIIVGILAALLGTWVASMLNLAETNGIDWIELIIQVAIAALGVTIAANMLGSRRRA
ncbi:GlsB/YeaQ/YmgE family stress response membrane protein [Actinotalea subterranea]|uniref:GlsB/YeaQ/YmgE family stress response membrane protein n=1 Tax=Actinotalea subterranea TaxID=2607497 RepID=UPI0011F08DE8|nr:GlsB/YeaQ/YmgE family stress response membrane protein [Actinotalea subterranea]